MKPELFGKYLLLDRLAAGGMGEVFLAKAGPRGYERYFAIKRILTQLAGSDEFLSMLHNEARISISLVHPNIAQVFEFGNVEGQFFMAMEYVEGPSLSAVLRSGLQGGPRIRPADGVAIARQVCQALDYAHGKNDTLGQSLGIVHRDISPQNILIDANGSAKLIDFGIAKASNSQGLTQDGTIKGKIAYMSPEQSRGEPIDRRSDLYAVGLVLYESIAYQQVFPGDNVMDVLRRVQAGDIQPIREVVSEPLPDSVIYVLDRATALEKDQRYSNAREMERDLVVALSDLDPTYTNHVLSDLVRQVDGAAAEGRNETVKRFTGLHPDDFTRPLSSGGLRIDGAGQDPQTLTIPGGGVSAEQAASSRRLRTVAMAVAAVLALGFAVVLVRALTSRDNNAANARTVATRSVALESEPSEARVLFDGKPHGKTPLVIDDVSPDRDHIVRLEKDGYAPLERTIAAGRGALKLGLALVPAATSGGEHSGTAGSSRRPGARATPTKAAKAENGCVLVVVNPWAYVEVDGKRVGTTPIKCLSLAAGKQKLTLSNPAINVSKVVEVTVKAAQTVRVVESFE